ncbi:MAG: homoserine dehydrogenase [Eubacteriales bacterium]|nr:homoserine dehydrogenase [Eubacteriales bacterium]
MINVAVLGYGTIGAGVVQVLQKNADSIESKAGQKIVVKRILDLRDFPGDPNENLVVHDYNIIKEDEDIQVVVECMGGVNPAYTFVKTALEQGRSVATSNKELVAKHGAELIGIAREKNANFLFEASVGGGIPIIRPLTQCLTADVIEEITGILNGTTNYMLTKMDEEGSAFDDVLKEAQQKGYAELHPEADVEGFDACRKIAILTSLATGKQVDFEDIHTEGITKITAEDFLYAKALNSGIKLLATSWSEDGKYFAMVSPMMVEKSHPLYGVRDVFNAIFVHGNMVDDTMFYGRGAGKLPTASAVAADVVDCVKHLGTNIKINWSPEKLELEDISACKRSFFVRTKAGTEEESIKESFGDVTFVSVDGIDEKAFVTGIMAEADYTAAAEKLGTVIQMIRVNE